MNKYATPEWLMAIGKELDCIAQDIKATGKERAHQKAERLRNLAAILEQKI